MTAPAVTASEGVVRLVDSLAADCSTRLVDVTGRRSRVLTGADLAKQVCSHAGSLASQGLAAGETVLFVVRPSFTAVAAFLGLVMAGARIAFVDLTAPERLVERQVRQVAPDWVLTEPVLAAAARLRLGTPAAWLGVRLPPVHRLAPAVLTTRRHRRAAWHPAGPAQDPGAEALVLYTSGTTGAGRAVVHTQATLGESFAALVDLVGDADEEVVYADRFHGFLPAIAAGAQVVLGTPGAHPETMARLLATQGVTTWFTTPSTAVRVVRFMTDSTALGHVVLGSEPVTKAVVEEIRGHRPAVRVTAVYGMSEVAPVAVATGEDILAFAGSGDLAGRVAGDLRIEFDPAGEVIVFGDRVAGYLHERGGSVRTGDLGHLTSQGALVLDGRRSGLRA